MRKRRLPAFSFWAVKRYYLPKFILFGYGVSMTVRNMFVRCGGVLILCLVFSASLLAAEEKASVDSADAKTAAEGKGAESQNKKAESKKPALDYIAIVNGDKIGMGEYISALRSGMRKKFYHGKIPEEEAKKFRKEVAEELVERKLLVEEAKRRNIKPDSELVELSLQDYENRFKDNPEWQKAKDKVLPLVREKLEGDSLKQRLEKAVHEVDEPSEAQLRDYYNKHPELFTTPERVKVSMILLRVDPSSPSKAWEQANEEAASIVERINDGADFAELARIHSSDESAQQGGDMGFVHTGMLGQNAQQVLDLMEPGEISAPVVLLEGVAIFKLVEREKPKLNDFASVKERAGELYMRDTGEKAWTDLLSSLKEEATIEYNNAPWR
jgi:parvulin-like peptidyl-prolyl isomerase